MGGGAGPAQEEIAFLERSTIIKIPTRMERVPRDTALQPCCVATAVHDSWTDTVSCQGGRHAQRATGKTTPALTHQPTSSPTLTIPCSTLPVTTVPRPAMENTSSTGIRNGLSRAVAQAKKQIYTGGSTKTSSARVDKGVSYTRKYRHIVTVRYTKRERNT